MKIKDSIDIERLRLARLTFNCIRIATTTTLLSTAKG